MASHSSVIMGGEGLYTASYWLSLPSATVIKDLRRQKKIAGLFREFGDLTSLVADPNSGDDCLVLLN